MPGALGFGLTGQMQVQACGRSKCAYMLPRVIRMVDTAQKHQHGLPYFPRTKQSIPEIGHLWAEEGG